ncbi:hypothetical protein [Jannaschia seosinensis]|nr:hypothetical protein [Jannaschia seosinensis]
MDYRQSPYLRHLTEAELLERFRNCFSVVMDLNDDGKIIPEMIRSEDE